MMLNADADDDGATNGFLRLWDRIPEIRELRCTPASTLLILSDKVFSQIGVAWLNNDYFMLLHSVAVAVAGRAWETQSSTFSLMEVSAVTNHSINSELRSARYEL